MYNTPTYNNIYMQLIYKRKCLELWWNNKDCNLWQREFLGIWAVCGYVNITNLHIEDKQQADTVDSNVLMYHACAIVLYIYIM